MNGHANTTTKRQAPPPHTLPIAARSKEDVSWLQAAGFLVCFLTGCICVNASQFVVLPLKWVDRRLYERAVGWTKGAFGSLLGEFLLCSSWTSTDMGVSLTSLGDG